MPKCSCTIPSIPSRQPSASSCSLPTSCPQPSFTWPSNCFQLPSSRSQFMIPPPSRGVRNGSHNLDDRNFRHAPALLRAVPARSGTMDAVLFGEAVALDGAGVADLRAQLARLLQETRLAQQIGRGGPAHLRAV